jgi:hypothetical protein
MALGLAPDKIGTMYTCSFTCFGDAPFIRSHCRSLALLSLSLTPPEERGTFLHQVQQRHLVLLQYGFSGKLPQYDAYLKSEAERMNRMGFRAFWDAVCQQMPQVRTNAL